MNRLFATCFGLILTCSVMALDAPTGSDTKHQATQQSNNHWVVLGAIERIKGAVTPERDVRVRGRVTETLWQLPSGMDSQQGFEFMKSQMPAASHVLFECVSRACGSSNDYANQVFEHAILYGREATQYYWVGLKEPETDRQNGELVVLYANTRSNKRSYIYVERVELAAGEVNKLAPLLVASQTKTLMRTGFHVLSGAQDDKGLSVAQVTWIKALLNDYPNEKFALVVHGVVAKQPDENKAMAEKKAQLLLDQIAKAGGLMKNLYAYGVGAAAPRQGYPMSRVELVVLDR